MPRKWLELIRDWADVQAGKDYVVRCQAVTKHTDPPGMEITLEFLQGDQAGRTMSVVLPTPILPSSLTRAFLAAAHLNVALGKRVAPEDAAGAVMSVRFDTDPASGLVLPVQFTSIPEAVGDRDVTDPASP